MKSKLLFRKPLMKYYSVSEWEEDSDIENYDVAENIQEMETKTQVIPIGGLLKNGQSITVYFLKLDMFYYYH